MTQDDRDREQEEEARHAAALEKLWAARKLGGKAMAANGNGGKFGLGPFTWGTLVVVLVLGFGCLGTWFSVQAGVETNASNIDSTKAEMKADYMPREVSEYRFATI